MNSDAAPRYSVADLRWLDAAMDYTGNGASGHACIHWAAALALDLRAGLLTFGTLRAANDDERARLGPGAARAPFIHAWVEVGDLVYAPTTVARVGLLVPMDRAGYYALNGATDVRRLPRARFESVVRRCRFAAALKHRAKRAGGARLAEDLMRAAGVRWVVTPTRDLLASAPQA